MIAAPADSQPWPRHRWVAVTLIILAGQIALILWLASKNPTTQRAIVYTPKIYLPRNPQMELPDVVSPTLFILANRHGFSGQAWLQVLPPPPPSPPPPPDRPPPPLEYPVLQLGGALTEFLRTNLSGVFDLAPKPDLQFGIISPIENPEAQSSTLTVEGDLASRPLLSQFKLDSWPSTENAEILTNSIVQIGVDKYGSAFSAILIPPAGSGSKDADASALKLAKSAQFKPLRRSDDVTGDGSVQWGSLVFHWHTVPPATTNAPPINR